MHAIFSVPLAALATLAALTIAAPAYAQQAPGSRPDTLVRRTIEDVMAAIRSDPSANAGDPDAIARIVEQRFLPHTDFRRTTQLAVGPAWARATPAQQQAVFEQFQTLLVRTYATQLTQVRGEDTRFSYKPMPALAAGADDAVVRTAVVAGGEPMDIDYRLTRTGGAWKIYDINMMGAWMIQVYRQQFAQQIAKGGIDGLASFLRRHNRQD